VSSKFSEVSFLVLEGEQLYTTICISLPFARLNLKFFILCQALTPLLFLSYDFGIFASEIGEMNFLTNCYCKNVISPPHFVRE